MLFQSAFQKCTWKNSERTAEKQTGTVNLSLEQYQEGYSAI